MHHQLLSHKVKAIGSSFPWVTDHFINFFLTELGQLVDCFHFVGRARHAEGSMEFVGFYQSVFEVVALDHLEVFEGFWADFETKDCAYYF